MDPPLGAVVSVPAGRGIVRFCGAASFAPGKWVGIELGKPAGKNDGTINGVSYFHCKPNHGVFVRPSQVKIEDSKPSQPASPAPTPGPSAAPPSAVRPTATHKRTGSLGLVRTSSIGPPGSPRSGSPARTPSITASPLAPRTAPPRTLIRPPPTADSERSAVPSPAPVTQSRPSPALVTPSKPSVVTALPVKAVSTPSPLSDVSLRGISDIPPTRPTSPPVSPVVPKVVDDKEPQLQELRAKIRVLEAKREDEARHVRELETRLEEAERFVAVRPKLQAKLAQQQTELIDVRRDLADAKQLAELTESRTLDAQEQLEMAMLDKEVAEERAETAELEVEELKEKLASMEVELDVIKSGGAGGGEDDDPSVKPSMQFIQLEKQNERLKEALLRLREVSQETDMEQRRRISDLEKDFEGLDDLQNQYDSALGKLSNAEAQIEDLKQQLDASLEAEDMLVQLTNRTMTLSEKIEEQRITIEDLESLKELNDELEENHLETEKALQEEIDTKDIKVHELEEQILQLGVVVQDKDETISNFREYVVTLQTDLDSLRSQSQNATEESAKAATQSATMMSLTMKLQSSASKMQSRAIDFELRNIEIKEAQMLLSIVQPYLPQAYLETDSDSTSCFLFFQRLGMKADLINTIVAQAHGLPDALSGPVSETLVGVCEMRSRISVVSTLCKRFATVLRHCDVEAFLAVGRLYPDVAPLEKRIDMHIDLLRREEFRERECASDFNKIQSQFEHLAEIYFARFEYDIGEREQGLAWAMDHDLDFFTAAISLTNTSTQGIMSEGDIVLDDGGSNFEEDLFKPIQAVLQKVKIAKAQSKRLTKRLEELVGDSSAVKPFFVARLNELAWKTVPELNNFAISLAQDVVAHVSDARSGKSSFQLRKIMSLAQQMASTSVGKGRSDNPSPWQCVGDYLDQVLKEINAMLPLAIESDNIMKITGKAPWVTRVDEIKAAAAVNHEAERKLTQATEETQALARTLRSRDQAAQEVAVKIELLERRLEAGKKTADALTELEGEFSKARKQEAALREAMEQLQNDLDVLEKDNAKLKATAATHPERQAEVQRPEVEVVAIEGSLETSYLLEQLEALRGTVRFLRTENQYLKGQDLLREIDALPPLPTAVKRPATPPLEPSSLSDTDEEGENGLPRTPPTLRSLATETKVLFRDVIRFSASPRVVDLSAVNAKRIGADGAASTTGSKPWMSRKQTPAHQMLERKAEAEKLSRRVKGLLERTSGLSR